MTSLVGPAPLHRFLIRAIDPALGCPVLATILGVPDLEVLRFSLGDSASQDNNMQGFYILDVNELRPIIERFDLTFDPDGQECWLSRAPEPEGPPYLVHTNYELALMLDGVKPFAKFAVEYPLEPGDFPQEALFEPHVQSGLLIKRVLDEPFEKPIHVKRTGRTFDGMRQVFYARHENEWRIDAYLLVWRQMEHGPWNETLERLDGSLLGYTDAQNDWWIARLRRDRASTSFADVTAYVAVDAAALAWIRTVGERALQPDMSAPAIELVMHERRPDLAMLEDWMAASDAAAIIRVGLARIFLANREFGHRDGARNYLVGQEEVSALNRALTSSIEVIAESTREPSPRIIQA